MKSGATEEIGNALLKELIAIYGPPEQIHSDRGCNLSVGYQEYLCQFYHQKDNEWKGYSKQQRTSFSAQPEKGDVNAIKYFGWLSPLYACVTMIE